MYSGEHQEVITIHKLLSELPLVQSNKRINDHDTECILLADRVKWHHYPPKILHKQTAYYSPRKKRVYQIIPRKTVLVLLSNPPAGSS